MFPWPLEDTGISGGSSSPSGFRRRSSSPSTRPNTRWRQVAWANARPLPVQRGQLLARGVVAVHQPAQRPQRDVLDQRHRHGAAHQRAGQEGPQRRCRWRRTRHRWPRAAPGRPRATPRPGSRPCPAARRRRSRWRRRACRRAAGRPRWPRRPRPCQSPIQAALEIDHRRSVTRRCIRVDHAHGASRERGAVAAPPPHPRARREPVGLLARAHGAQAVPAAVPPPAPHRPRARAHRGPGDPGRQPPQLPGPVRDRLLRQAADLLRGQARAVRPPDRRAGS